MVINRGEIWWASLPDPVGSTPGYKAELSSSSAQTKLIPEGCKRPILIVQADEFNKSKINTLIAVAITSNLRLATAPGNILLTAKNSQLPRESVINVSQIITIDKSFLTEKVHHLTSAIMDQVDEGLRVVLKL